MPKDSQENAKVLTIKYIKELQGIAEKLSLDPTDPQALSLIMTVCVSSQILITNNGTVSKIEITP